jgi:hypothetical protein
MISVNDPSARPLSQKLLDRPELLRRNTALIPDRHRCHLVPYTTSGLERDLALALDIPLYGADPRLATLGTKSGSRRLFAAEGVPHPAGFGDLHTEAQLLHATTRLRALRPTMAEAIIKLNEGVAGEGNASVDLTGLPAPGTPSECHQIAHRRQTMRIELPNTPLRRYLAKLAQRGGVIEERIAGVRLHSPACSSAPHRSVRCNWCRPTTNSSPGPTGRATRAAGSPPIPPMRSSSAATPPPSGHDWPARALSAGSRSTSSSPKTQPEPGPRTPSNSTCARAAPPTPS